MDTAAPPADEDVEQTADADAADAADDVPPGDEVPATVTDQPDMAAMQGPETGDRLPAFEMVEEMPQRSFEPLDRSVTGSVRTAPLPSWRPRTIQPPETEDLAPLSAAPFPQPDSMQPRIMLRSAEPSEADVARTDVRPIDPETGAFLVNVFYATDRLPLGESISRIRWQTFAGVLAAGLLTLCFALATIFLRRRVVLGVLTVTAALFTAVLFHSANLKSQKTERLTDSQDRVYGSQRHQTDSGYGLEVGVARVSIPPDHRVGKVESPSILRLEFRENPEKHVVLQSVTVRPDDQFYSELSERIRQSPGEQAFVFVHGYNVTFDDAVKRTAQIAHDLCFAGAPICYSWPSKGGLAEYTRDEANVTWTVVHLEDFLNQVVHRTNARTVHLVAHSMGNRALLQALERIALRHDDSAPPFGQVVLAAPDVDAAEFRDRYAPTITHIARHVTLYASANDQALLASTKVHGHTRAGLSGDWMTVVEGVETIDVSPIDTSLIGHSYYGDNPLMIRDMRALVELSEPAANRPWLEPIARAPGLAYWIFRQGFDTGNVSVGQGTSLPDLPSLR
jgi:esterase/lipase superfamily enzyme